MALFDVEPTVETCPYCGQEIELLIDTSAGKQSYVEDCQVCCRPITVRVLIDKDGLPEINLFTEDEP